MNGEKVYSVSELTGQIREMLEGRFPSLAVSGEISNFRPSSTGHYYFTLKDREATLSAVMFRSRIGRLTFQPQDGQLVVARGGLSVYAQRGTYQLVCDILERAGRGEILEMLEQRKQRLAAEGLFDRARKRPLPPFPSRIGVITSPTGAALRDILQVLKRRNAGIDVVILPAAVQGAEAEAQIVAQIARANRWALADVLIVGRGGGSIEDLLPFSSEDLVRAVAASGIPIISAVGHEIDTSFCDLAADCRAPTPSAAAEMVCARREEVLARVQSLSQGLSDCLDRRIERIRLLFARFTPDAMERHMRMLMQPILIRFDDSKEELLRSMREGLAASRSRLRLAAAKIESCSPDEVLKRGYAVVRHGVSGRLVLSAAAAAAGDPIVVHFDKGELDAEVTAVRP